MANETESDDTLEYRLESGRERWQAIKATVSQAEDLNETLLERIEHVSFGARYTREADARGRVRLPKSDHAGKEVEVLVLDVRDPEEPDDG